jgi:exo-beta-1,3-glucanase (GH17 family)
MAYRDNAGSPELREYYDSPTNRLSGNAILSTSNNDIALNPRLGANPFGESSTALSNDVPYADVPRTRQHFGDRRGEFAPVNDTWMEKTSSRNKKIRWLVIVALGLAVLGGVAAAIAVTVSKRTSSGTNSNDSSNSVVNETNNDPSQFEKDPRLIQSFYGIAYTPEGSQLPDCGNSLADVITDIQLLSQLTTRVRLYGADCNQTELVLEAIKQTKVNMSVVVANYPIATDGGAAYTQQAILLEQAIQAYGTDHIIGMTVGNEFILDYLDANDATDPNGSVGDEGAEILLGFINDSKTMLKNMSVSLPVGNSDAGSYFNNLVLEDVDYGMANVHPWFANVSIEQAAGWTWSFFTGTDEVLSASLSNKPTMSIAETGWPTNATNAAAGSNGPSIASEANLQIYLDTFVCAANANGTEYYFFEYFDEPWKGEEFGGVEGYWGLFYSNRTLKGITIPNCTATST